MVGCGNGNGWLAVVALVLEIFVSPILVEQKKSFLSHPF